MKRATAKRLGLAAALLVVAGLALALPRGAATAQGEVSGAGSPCARTVTVVGEGTVTVAPDIARISIGYEAIATSVAEASAEASVTMAAIDAALAAIGIADEDVQTSEYNVYVESAYGNAEAEPVYHVINMVSVTVRDLATVGSSIDAAVQAGANRIYGVSFDVDSTATMEANARALAVADARSRAEHLAGLVGGSVGDVISVSEVVSSSYQSYLSSAKDVLGLGGGTSISPGRVEFTSSIQVVYELSAAGTVVSPEAAATTTAATGSAAGGTLVTTAAMTPADDTPSYALTLVANPTPTETQGGLFLVGWVQVVSGSESATVQALDVEFHVAYQRWDEADQIVGGLGYVITGDVNFDGYQDFAVIEPGGATWQVAHWFVFDAATGQFASNDFTAQLSLQPWNTYSLNPDTKEIAFVNQMATGALVTTYAVHDGALTLVRADEGAPTIDSGPFSPPPATTG